LQEKTMMTRLSYAVAAAIALVLPGAGWAQQQDLEVTMGVVPANATPDAVTKVITLPDAASPQGRESSAFGLGIANQAREMRGELGRDFGKEVSEAAKERAQTRGQGPGRP
jgi:hypothetical protein